MCLVRYTRYNTLRASITSPNSLEVPGVGILVDSDVIALWRYDAYL